MKTSLLIPKEFIMKFLKLLCLLLGVVAFTASSAIANPAYGTKEEAQAMAEKAAALVMEIPDSAF
jgi:hypothetical protein